MITIFNNLSLYYFASPKRLSALQGTEFCRMGGHHFLGDEEFEHIALGYYVAIADAIISAFLTAFAVRSRSRRSHGC
jgi:hypothetical protein